MLLVHKGSKPTYESVSNHERKDPINTEQRKHEIPQNPRLGAMNKDVIYRLLLSTTQEAPVS